MRPAGAELAERVVVGDDFTETLPLENDDVIQSTHIVEEFLHPLAYFVWCCVGTDDERVQSRTERTPGFKGMVDHANLLRTRQSRRVAGMLTPYFALAIRVTQFSSRGCRGCFVTAFGPDQPVSSPGSYDRR